MAEKRKPRVFLGTNVIISGLYSPHKSPGRILEYFIQGRIQVIISQQVLEELVRVIQIKLPEALPALNRFLMSSPPEIVEDPSPSEIEQLASLVHPEDAAILAASISAHLDYIVTGDNHFLIHPDILLATSFSILSPGQFVEMMSA
jgi:putative PIN family toxin of toxin-antitoxin system